MRTETSLNVKQVVFSWGRGGRGWGGGGLDLLNCTLAQFNSEDWIPILGLLSLNLHGFSALFHCTSHARISPQGHANNYSAKL